MTDTKHSPEEVEKLATEYAKAHPKQHLGTYVVMVYSAALWLIGSNSYSLLNAVQSVLARPRTLGAGDGVVIPLIFTVEILGILAGIGLFFFRDLARKVALITLVINGFLGLYSLLALHPYALNWLSGYGLYLMLTMILVPACTIFILLDKPVKQLFH